ncbi:MAG: serine/threonine-protein kinase [Planctomycetota bacterium]|nr:serine/threonine-protein kinase [Planctomycetota bacterium]
MDENALSDAWKKLVEDADSTGVNPAQTWKTGNRLMDSTRTQIGVADPAATLVANPDANTNVGPSPAMARNQGDLTIRAGAGKQTLALPVIPEKNLEILEEIGRGGMGAVYRAKQTQLRRIVAVKTSHVSPKGDMDFLSEAFITAYLDHPNIAPVHDLAVSDDNQLKLVMKLVSGQSWRDRLAADTCVDELLHSDLFDEHLIILQHVCQAVGFAHSRGIIHCDLKPDNVMLGDFGEVLLMDWGVALDFRDSESITVEDARALHRSAVTSPRGTPVYMPAELTLGAGDTLGPWTDIYLLGAILFELITGRPPHIGRSMAEVLKKSLGGERAELPSGTPEELRRIVEKALHSDVEQRFQSAGELRTALIEFRKHRESHWIAEAGRQTLVDCEKVIKSSPNLDSRLRNEMYADFAESVASFRQAQRLWPDNLLAKNGEFQARRSLAQFALRNGDLALAEANISRFSEDHTDRSRLQSDLSAALELELQEKRNKTWLKKGLVASVVAIVLGSSASAIILVEKNNTLNRQSQIVREQNKTITQKLGIIELTSTKLKSEKNRAIKAEESALNQSRKTYEAYRSLVVEVNDNLQGIMGQGVYDARLKLSQMALKGLSTGNKEGTLQNSGETKNVSAEASLNISQIQANLKQDKEAQESIDRVFSILKGIENDPEADRIRALGYKTLATMAMANKNLEAAKEHALKGLALNDQAKRGANPREFFRQVTAPLLLFLGQIFMEGGDNHRASKYYKDMLQISRQFVKPGTATPNETALVAKAQVKLGVTLRLLSQLKEAEPLFNSAKQKFDTLIAERHLYRDHYHGLINTLCGLSAIEESRGQKKKGMEYTQQAWEIAENLLLIDGNDKQSQICYVLALASHAFALQHNGQFQEAYNLNKRGYKYARHFVETGNKTKKMRRSLATFPMQMGRNLFDKNKHKEALPFLSDAIEVLEQLCKGDSDNTRSLESLILAYNDRAHAYQKTDQPLKAQDNFLRAFALLEKLSKTKRMTARRHRIAVMVGSNTARFLNQAAKHQEALKACKRALGYASNLIKLEPKNARSRRMLSVILYDMGTTCLQMKKYTEAADYFEQAAKNHEFLLKAEPELKREQDIFLKRAAQMRAKAKQ